MKCQLEDVDDDRIAVGGGHYHPRPMGGHDIRKFVHEDLPQLGFRLSHDADYPSPVRPTGSDKASAPHNVITDLSTPDVKKDWVFSNCGFRLGREVE